MAGRKGMVKRVPMQVAQARTRLWRSMQMLPQFSLGDLELTAEAGRSHVTKYARALLKAGYLRQVSAKRNGERGGHAVYMLARNTGPHAPRITNGGLLDPNLEPAAPARGEEPVTIKRSEYQRLLACARACAGMADPEAEVRQLRGLP